MRLLSSTMEKGFFEFISLNSSLFEIKQFFEKLAVCKEQLTPLKKLLLAKAAAWVFPANFKKMSLVYKSSEKAPVWIFP